MGLFKKIADAVQANLNRALERAEDPEKLASLALLELEEKKKRTHKLVVQAIARFKLAHKNQRNDPNFEELLSLEQETIGTLKQGIDALNEKIAKLRASNAAYSAPTAKATLEDINAFDTFDRMAQKIEDEEAALEALTTLLESDGKIEAVAPKPEAKAQAPIDAQALERELEELRKKLI